MVPSCVTADEVARALDGAREIEVEGPAIDYVLGSGEADEVALYAGIKPLLRQVLPSAEAARARFSPLGLHVEVARHRVEAPSTRGEVVFVARDPRLCAEAVRCENAPDHDAALGRLLGYPRCCVEAYLELPPPRRNVTAFARAASETCAARLNVLDLAVFHYVSWLPCSFDCAWSRTFADAVAAHIRDRHGQFLARGRAATGATCPPDCRHERFVAAIDAALGAHRLLLTEDVQLSLRGRFDRAELTLEAAWPTARDRPPDAPLAPDARRAVARLLGRVQDARRLALDEHRVLWVDGEPVLHAPDALLLPFG